ncbi:hypothetical protein GCM10018785_02370 [Streptomyces longispororuber]|uniref:Uncharacterized protein n=1 Tax=Streptomyces longispororuber TaxID=68230 RepID=A0A918Z4A9_9ACTN|nr:hypothetical protein GCM10018785_02370 [Streptomyces longispororuber]
MEAALPHASEDERGAATGQRLHQDVTAGVWAREAEWEQGRARQAAAKARAEARQPASSAPPSRSPPSAPRSIRS